MSARTTGLCSAICRALDEPLPGTAVVATGWVVVEQPGPWGAKAPTESHLDREFGARIDAACKKTDLRFGLIRTPGRHPDLPHSHQVYVASTVPGRSWLLGGTVADPTALDALDLAAVRRGDQAAVLTSLPQLTPVHQPILLVCTNGKRDECCAILGRPIVQALAAQAPGRVWEANHLGGHRFAPTATLLPAGTMHGHLDLETATAVLTAADRGETVLTGLRGRSSWTKRGQAAEIAVRHLIGETGLDSLSVDAENLDTVTVRHADGRAWTVPVTSETAHPARPESCGKEPFAMSILRTGTPVGPPHQVNADGSPPAPSAAGAETSRVAPGTEPLGGFEDLLAANEKYAADFRYSGFDGIAHAGVGVVTCMDSRIPPLEMLGLKPGDAKVLRSAGGRVTEVTLTGLVLGVQLLGVRRIMIIPHTRCAMAAMTEDALRAKVEQAAGKPAGYLPIAVIPDQLEALRHDVIAVRQHPLIGGDTLVGGFMYDVDTGRLTQHA